MKLLVIGINQPPTGYKNGKQTGTIRRLNQWMSEFGIRNFSFSNIHEGKEHLPLNKVDYKRLIDLTEGYDKIITLGDYPSKALNRIGVNHFKLPHPSGLNRLLNDKEFMKNILDLCKKYIHSNENTV